MARHVSEDILLLIFDAAVDAWSTPNDQWPDVVYSADCAAAPFHLAAVCRQWRTLMLATSTLWTYFGFPQDPQAYLRHHGRLSLLLERSRNAPVVVILSIPADNYRRHYFSNQSDSQIDHILKAISDIAPRWRAAFLKLPTVLMWSHFRRAFRGNCPLLKSLAMMSGDGDISIPRAPRLERLCFVASFDAGTIEPQLAQEDRLQYPSLKWLLIYSQLGSRAAALYRPNSSDLRHLCILRHAGDFPLQPLQCPNLSSITLDDPGYLDHIVAPKLHQLALSGDFPIGSLRDDWSSVTTLILYGAFQRSSLAYLQLFQCVETLILDLPPELRAVYDGFETAYKISPSFFAKLRGARPLIWPRLRRINFAGPFSLKFPVGTLDGLGLISFVAQRNAEALDMRDEGERPAKIEEVLLGDPAISTSTREKLAILTGNL